MCPSQPLLPISLPICSNSPFLSCIPDCPSPCPSPFLPNPSPFLHSHPPTFQEVDTSILGISKEQAAKFPYIASMGIYVFKKDILLKLLRWVWVCEWG